MLACPGRHSAGVPRLLHWLAQVAMLACPSCSAGFVGVLLSAWMGVWLYRRRVSDINLRSLHSTS